MANPRILCMVASPAKDNRSPLTLSPDIKRASPTGLPYRSSPPMTPASPYTLTRNGA